MKKKSFNCLNTKNYKKLNISILKGPCMSVKKKQMLMANKVYKAKLIGKIISTNYVMVSKILWV